MTKLKDQQNECLWITKTRHGINSKNTRQILKRKQKRLKGAWENICISNTLCSQVVIQEHKEDNERKEQNLMDINRKEETEQHIKSKEMWKVQWKIKIAKMTQREEKQGNR